MRKLLAGRRDTGLEQIRAIKYDKITRYFLKFWYDKANLQDSVDGEVIPPQFLLKYYIPKESEMEGYNRMKKQLFQAANYIKQSSISIHQYLMKLSTAEFVTQYEHLFHILQYPQVISQICS